MFLKVGPLPILYYFLGINQLLFGGGANRFVEKYMFKLYLKCGCLGYKSNYFLNIQVKISRISLNS